ncbi:MAG: fructose-1,6-bisphosphatase [Christensenellaceae bacterium]|nr:fructose-1,6-bisphosphatase [Christensenellaceae bacterium]
METNLRYLTLLSRDFPTVQSVCAEIINLNAIRALPKGTEHFMSDIHGEHEAFLHILNNGSGAIYEKIDEMFEKTLTLQERRALAVLIYYPRETLADTKKKDLDLADWYRVAINRLITMGRYTTVKYSRSKVRKALPPDFAYIMEELLTTHDSQNKEAYYDNIVRSIIDTGCADTLIMELCTFIKRMAVDALHIVGDIFDRGPHADVILEQLMAHHSVDIQWGNHDVLWMGAAAGNPACVATAVKNCVQYDNLDMLENSYGINLLPLALFATEQYKDADVFQPRKLPVERFRPRDLTLYARMHKAISVIQFKLEGQLVKRRPEYGMRDRDMLSRIDWAAHTIEIDGATYPLRDADFPTVDHKDPNKLSHEEKALLEQLVDSFRQSDSLQAHTRFLYSAGSIYCRHNGNLLYHGCLPCDEQGKYLGFRLYGKQLRGKEFLDFADQLARQGYFSTNQNERERGGDFLWFLWCGRNSPIFGRDHIATFERTLIEDAATWKEPKNPYYEYYDNEDFCRGLLEEFDLHKPWSRIINGHMPVRVKEGEDPRKAGGRLVVIDGGFCEAYQNQTGIAGYTMFFSSHGMRIAAHEPFAGQYDAIHRGSDITSHSFIVENLPERLMIADTDMGDALLYSIQDLEALLAAYRSGSIKTNSGELNH